MSEETLNDINQYLTFMLGEEVFALNISTVREVLELTNITRIPRTPKFMRGVINLRGHAVPVVDLRQKFGMSPVKETVDTCIIIVECGYEGEDSVMGAMVDSVNEVFEMQPDSIESAPKMGTVIKAEYIQGMGKQEGHFIIILDIGRIFSPEELSMVQQAASAGEPQATASETPPKEEAPPQEPQAQAGDTVAM